MTDPCPNCAQLKAELETARDELRNGIEVLNKREEHSRAEVAQLKAELADLYSGAKVAAEGLAARVAELLARP